MFTPGPETPHNSIRDDWTSAKKSPRKLTKQHQWRSQHTSDLQKPPKIYESSPDDEKRRNYGGVYVGLASDMTTVAGSQSKSTDKN
ncbi:overexpressed in colon carcinoma 1 protein [Salvelinus alpinus]